MKRSILFILFLPLFVFAQKKPLDVYDLMKFKVIENYTISNDGQWIVAEVKPYRGDPLIVISDNQKNYYREFQRAEKFYISPENNFIAFLVKPSYDTLRKLKIKGVKKDKLPKDSAYVFITSSKEILKFDKVKSIITPKESGKNLAILRFYPDSLEKEYKKDVYQLLVVEPEMNKIDTFDFVNDAVFSKNGRILAFTKVYKIDKKKEQLAVFVFDGSSLDSITAANSIKKLTADYQAEYVAYMSSNDTNKQKKFALWLYEIKSKKLIKVFDTTTFAGNWTANENKDIVFSKNGSKLFFEIKHPLREVKDTVPEDEKIKVDIWSWTDSLLMPQQLKNLDKDKKAGYLIVYHIENQKLVKLQHSKYDRFRFYQDRDGDYALILNNAPYLKLISWEYPWWYNVYRVNFKTGERKLVAKKVSNFVYMSPSGNYVVWYNHRDSNWYSFSFKKNKVVRLTDKSLDIFYDDENDEPAPANPYGYVGFLPKDEKVLIYSKYDIWAFDPEGKTQPICITNFYGKNNKIVFRVFDLNKDDDYLNPEATVITGFNKVSKEEGIYKLTSFKEAQNPQQVIYSDHHYYGFKKAKNADVIIYRRSRVDEYPDIWITKDYFETTEKITTFINQQNKYIWATVRLVHWTTTDGNRAEGLLFLPENFDSTKSYPMIVYYYERYSDYKNRYFTPTPSRSIINPIHYASNGYIVFIPNIRYKIGYPGMSAYNYVVSGTLAMIERYKWIDKEHIGLQGQSWGGYQTAYIITQTDMFAAAMAGAPVSNMTSAYGGIRWRTGLSRMFQYEKTQSRIGGTLWDKLPLYIYNSPLFYAPKINTPLLIMHNDKDGAVPWYQGIELFVALRRLNKPVWLLNYNGEPHNLKPSSPNRVDLTIRMMQFFDHYLKGKPMPYWMKYGIPAVQKGRNLGYQLVE